MPPAPACSLTSSPAACSSPMPRLSVRTVTTCVGPSEDALACGSATVAIRSRAVRAEPRTRHACTTSRWPRRTKPSASSLDRSAAEPATLRPVLASKTPRSQSPPPLSRAWTRPVASAV